jgi:hypothetical protein
MEESEMSVISPDEKADFVAILQRHRLAESDFKVEETALPDMVDDVYPLQGHVSITRASTLKERGYRIGHGTQWTADFEQDLDKGAFN